MIKVVMVIIKINTIKNNIYIVYTLKRGPRWIPGKATC